MEGATRKHLEDQELLFACAEAKAGLVAKLLERGRDVEARSATGMTPLLLAVRKGDVSIVRQLLAVGADPDATTKLGNTAAMYAAKDGLVKVLSVLVEYGADLGATNVQHDTCLLWATQAQQKASVTYLLDQSRLFPTLLRSNEYGMTPLMCAASHGALELIQALLSFFEVDAGDEDGATALHFAAVGLHADAIELLCDAGANVFCRDTGGKTPLEMLIEAAGPEGPNQEACIEELIHHEAEATMAASIQARELLQSEWKQIRGPRRPQERTVNPYLGFFKEGEQDGDFHLPRGIVDTPPPPPLLLRVCPQAELLDLSVKHILGEELETLSEAQLEGVERTLEQVLGRVREARGARRSRQLAEQRQWIAQLEERIVRLESQE